MKLINMNKKNKKPKESDPITAMKPKETFYQY